MNGPILIPTRVLNTGSVRIVKPSTRINTVLWPIHAACNPSSGQDAISGIRGDGLTGRFRSSDRRCQKRGAARNANPARELILLIGRPHAGTDSAQIAIEVWWARENSNL